MRKRGGGGDGERRVSVSLPAVFRSFAIALLGRLFRSSALTESLAQTIRWSAFENYSPYLMITEERR